MMYPQQQQQQMHHLHQQRTSTVLGAPGMGGMGMGAYGGSTPNLGVYGNGGVTASASVNALPLGMPMPQQAYGMPMAGAGGPPGLDMVERWRQGVMP
jgi:hypothetical protein